MNTTKHPLILTTLFTLVLSGTAQSETDNEWRIRMEQRMSQLEQLVKSQQAAIAQRDQQIKALKADKPATQGWFQQIKVGGVVEVEANHSSADGAPDSSDIQVSTVELGISAQVHDWVGSEIVLLYEDTGNSNGQINVDTAAITVSDPNANWLIAAGQFTLPFGVFSSNMVSDPLTLDLGETADAALSIGTSIAGFNAALFVFEGDQGATRLTTGGTRPDLKRPTNTSQHKYKSAF